jgi:hypothetical protein
MDNYIEIAGQAWLVEQVEEYRADLTLTVRAAQADTALSEGAGLRDQCIRTLRDAGIGQDEMSEGGKEVWRPWYWKKKEVGQESAFKILLACPDAGRLYAALDALQPLFANARYTLTVSMRKPQFGEAEGAREEAQTAAIGDARAKASLLAAAAGVRLGAVCQVEELDTMTGRSGSYGDQDWGAYPMAAGAAGGGDEPAFDELKGATRKSRIRFRVRFGLAA